MKNNVLNKFNKEDTYSLSLFSLYKLIEDPEYSTLSELPYVLDETNLINLCTYFGGTTIKIPTLDEIYSLMNILLLYDYINFQKLSFEEAFSRINWGHKNTASIRKVYNKLSKVLDKYEFKFSHDVN